MHIERMLLPFNLCTTSKGAVTLQHVGPNVNRVKKWEDVGKIVKIWQRVGKRNIYQLLRMSS